jgi:hypothetical protein
MLPAELTAEAEGLQRREEESRVAPEHELHPIHYFTTTQLFALLRMREV